MKKNKIKDVFTNNVGIKIIAVIVAAIVWLAVVNVSDPEKSVTIYNIPIEITNEKTITDMGMVYDVTSKKKVNITITGKRSVVSGLNASDFTAKASLKELSKVNAIPISIRANNRTVGRKIDILSQSMQTVTVSVEELKTKTYPIEAVYIGKVAEGFIAEDYSLSFSQVDIKAPVSIHKKIKKVVAVCNLNYNDEDFASKCKLTLYDSNDNKISNRHTKLSKTGVKVSVSVSKQKGVPINVVTQPRAREGYQISNIVLSQNNVYLTGNSKVLETIEQIDISDAIDVSDKTDDTTINVNLYDFIPRGIGINGDTSIDVTVEIKRLQTKKITLKASDISILKVPKKLKATILNKKIEVTLEGQEQDLDGIKASDLKASIDVSNLKKGKHNLALKVVMPDGVNMKSNVNIKVELK